MSALTTSAHRITRYHVLVFIGCWLGGMFDGMDSTLMTVVLPSAIGDLVHSMAPEVIGHYGSLVGSAFLFGWMLGGVLIGMVGDRLGRIRSMILSIMLYAVFTGLAGLSQTWWQLALCRFLTGLGIGGELVSITTFLAEVWPERSRAIAIGILITSYQAGVLVAGTIVKFIPFWRTVFFIGALPAVLTVLLRLTLRESERWMESKQQMREDYRLLGELFAPEHRRNLAVGAIAFGGLLIGYWASLSWIPAWIQTFFPPSEGSTQRAVATMWQGSAAVVGCTLAGWSADRIGRIPTIVISYAGCFLSSALLFLTNDHFSDAIYAESAALGFFIGLAQAIMYVYLPELFPTRIRATAVGFCLNAGRLSTAIAVLFVGVIVRALGGFAQSAMLFAGAYLFAVAAAWWATETKGKPLPA
ncbi:MAG: MFS transporter [Chlorobiota bacterium]|nr:MAG: MFS transporter [Chlorobiota bacterium]